MTIELGIFAILVARDHEFVAVRCKVRTKPEFTGDTADEFSRLEPQRPAGRRQCLTVRIGLEDGNVVEGVFRRIAGDGIGIENAENFGHDDCSVDIEWFWRCGASTLVHAGRYRPLSRHGQNRLAARWCVPYGGGCRDGPRPIGKLPQPRPATRTVVRHPSGALEPHTSSVS